MEITKLCVLGICFQFGMLGCDYFWEKFFVTCPSPAELADIHSQMAFQALVIRDAHTGMCWGNEGLIPLTGNSN